MIFSEHGEKIRTLCRNPFLHQPRQRSDLCVGATRNSGDELEVLAQELHHRGEVVAIHKVLRDRDGGLQVDNGVPPSCGDVDQLPCAAHALQRSTRVRDARTSRFVVEIEEPLEGGERPTDERAVRARVLFTFYFAI